jgi:hypothetical protein
MLFDEFVELARAGWRIGKLRPTGIFLPECAHTIFQGEVVLDHLEAWKDTSATRCSTKMVLRLAVYSTALRPKAYLAGRSGHEAQGSGMSLG